MDQEILYNSSQPNIIHANSNIPICVQSKQIFSQHQQYTDSMTNLL